MSSRDIEGDLAFASRMDEEVASWCDASRKQYGPVFDAVRDVLLRFDPLQIRDRPDHPEWIRQQYNPPPNKLRPYDPEVHTLLPKLAKLWTGRKVTRVVHETFKSLNSFRPLEPESYFQPIAVEVWSLWKRRRSLAP